MKDLLKELDELVGDKKNEEQTEAAGSDDAIIQHIALAAQVAGVDLEDDDQLKDFMGKVKDVITKDKSKLRSQLRRWTAGKARAAVKATKGAIG